MTKAEIERIARGLTEAQRSFILRECLKLRAADTSAKDHQTINSTKTRIAHVLRQKGILDGWKQTENPLHEPLRSWWEWAFTPLGLAVRAYLENSDG